MPLNWFQRRRFNRSVNAEMQKILRAEREGYDYNIAAERQDREEHGELITSAGLDTRGFYSLMDHFLIRTIDGAKSDNPYLNVRSRQMLETIATGIEAAATEMAASRTRNMALGTIAARSAPGSDVYNQARALERDCTDQEELIQRQRDAYIGAMLCIQGKASPDGLPDEYKAIVRSRLNIDFDDPQTLATIRQRELPDTVSFELFDVRGLDRGQFITQAMNAAAGAAPPTGENRAYGVGSFGRAFNGIFGNNGEEPERNDPMYLGRFDHIMIDGESVTDRCREATQGLPPRQAAEFMMCHTTSAALERTHRISVDPPEVTFAQDANGKTVKTFTGRYTGTETQVISDVHDPAPKLGIFQRFLRRIGLYQPSDPNAAYQQVLADPETADINRLAIERIPAKIRRDAVQRQMIEQQMEADAPHNSGDAFFHPDDLHELNPDIPAEGDTRSYFTELNVHDLATLNRPQSRTNLARLYMLSRGFTEEQIFSNDSAMLDAKRACGREFYNILHNGTHEQVADCYVGMSRALASLPILDIDYSDDAQLAAHRNKLLFRSNGAKDVMQSMRLGVDTTTPSPITTAFRERIPAEDMRRLQNAFDHSDALTSATDRFSYITSSETYSSANTELQRRAGIEPNRQNPVDDKNAAIALSGLQAYNAQMSHLKGAPAGLAGADADKRFYLRAACLTREHEVTHRDALLYSNGLVQENPFAAIIREESEGMKQKLETLSKSRPGPQTVQQAGPSDSQTVQPEQAPTAPTAQPISFSQLAAAANPAVQAPATAHPTGASAPKPEVVQEVVRAK